MRWVRTVLVVSWQFPCARKPSYWTFTQHFCSFGGEQQVSTATRAEPSLKRPGMGGVLPFDLLSAPSQACHFFDLMRRILQSSVLGCSLRSDDGALQNLRSLWRRADLCLCLRRPGHEPQGRGWQPHCEGLNGGGPERAKLWFKWS